MASIYTKDELPTFSEMYFHFYRKKLFVCSEDTKEMEPYWNIPVDKFVLMVSCNQLNKMIFEDGFKKNIMIQFPDIKDIRFILTDDDTTVGDYKDKFNAVSDVAPPIYTIPLPTGKENVFIVNKHPRISSTDMNADEYQLKALINGNKTISPVDDLSQRILQIMMFKYEDYFNNMEENLKKGEYKNNFCVSGYDPAK